MEPISLPDGSFSRIDQVLRRFPTATFQQSGGHDAVVGRTSIESCRRRVEDVALKSSEPRTRLSDKRSTFIAMLGKSVV